MKWFFDHAASQPEVNGKHSITKSIAPPTASAA
jgi:hypothetical protein